MATAPTAAAERKKPRSADELMNVLLSPRYAQWLVGPIARLASDEEIEAYLALAADEEAERFIDDFWARRPSATGIPGLTVRDIFRRRSQEADKQFSEAAYPGRRTDRGTIFILYGAPEKVSWQPARRQREALVEIWEYDPADAVGLDGSRPERRYYFQRRGDLTVFAPPASIPRHRL